VISPLSLDSLPSRTTADFAARLPRSRSVRQSASPADTPAGAKLRKAAAEFESMLLSNLWKSMKSSLTSADDDASDPAHEILDDMGIQAMSSAVGKTGGLGLGKLILKHLVPTLTHSTQDHALQPGKASAFPADTFLETR
jgi:Rod binding domain-containing protein